MEPGIGTNDESRTPSSGLSDTAGRFIGFYLFALPAMVIIAAVVLLPAYMHLEEDTRYEYACLKAKVQLEDQRLAANRRLIKDIPEDEVLATRYVMSQSNLTPMGEVVVSDPETPPRPPIMIEREPYTPPAHPEGRLLALAHKIEHPKIRCGLLLLAVGAIGAGLFFFSPPRRKG